MLFSIVLNYKKKSFVDSLSASAVALWRNSQNISEWLFLIDRFKRKEKIRTSFVFLLPKQSLVCYARKQLLDKRIQKETAIAI